MLTGLDTGFFFALQEKQPLALSVWMERETITSVIVLYELQKKLLKGSPGYLPYLFQFRFFS